jgi:hypothetical protein
LQADLVTNQELKQIISEMKFDLLKWIVGLSLAQFGLLVGVLLKMG